MKVLLVEKARILLIHGLVDVFEDPSAQCEKLIADAHNVAVFRGTEKRGDQPAAAFGGEEL
jgi:hypothetical protein